MSSKLSNTTHISQINGRHLEAESERKFCQSKCRYQVSFVSNQGTQPSCQMASKLTPRSAGNVELMKRPGLSERNNFVDLNSSRIKTNLFFVQPDR